MTSDPRPTPPAEPPRQRTADPGWYPVKGGRHRWWDGNAWTDQWTKSGSWSKSAEVGMWLAILLPPIGFLMGLALVAGRDNHAHWVVVTSIAVPVLLVLLLAN